MKCKECKNAESFPPPTKTTTDTMQVDTAEPFQELLSPPKATPRDEWPVDADYALGHLAGCLFGILPTEEIAHCVKLIRDALEKNDSAGEQHG